MDKEPTLAERLEAQAAAKRRLLERFKPKPHVPAPPEAFVVDEGALEALRLERRAARQAEKERRWAAQAYIPRQPDPVVVAEAKASQAAAIGLVRVDKPTVYYTRSRQLARTSAFTKALILEMQAGRCYLCGHGFSQANPPTTDHVTPRARRGANVHNRLMACQGCNGAKGDRAPHPCELLYLTALNLMLARWTDTSQLE